MVARNVGTARANQVDLRSPPGGPTVHLYDRMGAVDVDHSISATVLLFEEVSAMWVELTWCDHFGLPRQQLVDLIGA